MHRISRAIFPVFAIFFLTAFSAWAQFAQRGGVAGTIFDLSGAVIPDAEVTLVDLDRNHTQNIKSNRAGHFEFDNLTAGQYGLTVKLRGFETETSQQITVNISEIAHFDFKLHPGTVEQSVTVSAEAAGLQTNSVALDTNVTKRQFAQLPLNGRNFTSIAALVPGVSTYPGSNQILVTNAMGAMFAQGGTEFTAGGAFEGSRDNGFYINGVNINDNYESSISYEPSAEALGTATIQVANFSAATGRDFATMSLQTKGGTSQFHGEAYDFIENTAFNAVNPWDHANEIITDSPVAKPTLIRNQFGGNLGGPVYLPKLLPKSKDRLFFFANYEKFIESLGNQLVTASVPSSAERSGDFSELLCGAPACDGAGTNPNPIQLYNPFLTTYDPTTGLSSRPAIPGNRLDLANRPDGAPLIDPGAAAIQNALWPLPNIPNTPSNEVNFTAFQGTGITDYHFDSRLDAIFTGKDSVFVTWSQQAGQTRLTGGIPPSLLYNSPISDNSRLVTANYVHIFTPRLTNEFLFGEGEAHILSILPNIAAYNDSSNPVNSLFQNTGTGLNNKGTLAVFVSGYATPGLGEASRGDTHSLQFSDNLDWIFGNHTVTAGFNYIRKSEDDWDIQRNVCFGSCGISSQNGLGAYTSNVFTSSGGASGYQGGDGMADLTLGIPADIWVRYNIAGGPTAPLHSVRMPEWGMYANDQYRINAKLIVSAGLRYSLSIPGYAPSPHTSPCCAIYVATADGGVMQYPGVAPGLPTHYVSAPKLDFAPRLSVVYSPRESTVIRAGYGIFYDTGASQVSFFTNNALYGTSGSTNYNVNNATLGDPPDTPALTLANIFPVPPSITATEFPVPTGPGEGYDGDNQLSSITYYDQKSVPLPYYQRMLLDLQQQVGSHGVFTLSYMGAQGRKGPNVTNINLPPYQTGWTFGGGDSDPTFNAARPNHSGRFGDVYVIRPNVNSFYNALVVQYRHNFSKGYELLGNYTWSKTISDYPYSDSLIANGATGAGVGGFQYPNLRSRGEATHSHPQRFVLSGIWEPVYGATWPHFAKLALAGWRISGIVTMESGDALTVTNGGPGAACSTADAGTSSCPTGYGTSAQDGAGFDELYASGNANIGHFKKSFSRQFDTSKFSIPPQNVRGNSGFGTVIGPGQERVDLSVAKSFPIYELFHLELRFDAFNALNHSQWNGVNTQLPSGSTQYPFGQVNSAGDARVGQVAAKLVF